MEPIRSFIATYVDGWTFDRFVHYVQYEGMFYDTCIRMEDISGLKAANPEVAASYKLTRQTTGYNGFPTEVVETITLLNVDGDVPPFDPEEDTENMGARPR